MAGSFVLNHALHGYADGHQLIASSVELDRDAQSQLLIMSDLSGPAFRTGFESYLTGYPIVGSNFYCLARTWFAPELPRPGCVWTHSLLIRNEDVARVLDFRSLLDTFRRPDINNTNHYYENAIHFDEVENDWSKSDYICDEILRGLYGSNKNVVVPSGEAAEYEDLFLALFSQQWPRLRRNFRFCTGALSLRESEFDLSVSPPEVTHSVGANGLVVHSQFDDEDTDEEWIELATTALASNILRNELRDFLWQYGPDYTNGRSAFRPLVEAFLLLRPTNEVIVPDHILSAVAHYFPDYRDGPRLKRDLFGYRGLFQKRLGGEAATLRLLVSHPLAGCVGSDVADIKERASILSRENPAATYEIALLAARIGSGYAEQFLEGFLADGPWPAELIREAPSKLIGLMLDRNGSLVESPALWTREDRMVMATKLINSNRLDASPEVISAMIEADSWETLIALLQNTGSEAVQKLFKQLETSGGSTINAPAKLYDFLGDHVRLWSEFLLAGSVGPKVLKILSAELDPRSSLVRNVGIDSWLKAAKHKAALEDKSRALRSALFFLSLGFSSWEDNAAILVAAGFKTVYQSAAKNELDDGLWQQLEPNLVWYSPSWDKCARLIRTAARAFKDRKWPVKQFFDAFHDVDTFKKALQELDDVYGGQRYLRSIKKAVEGEEVEITREKMKLLSEY